MKKFMFPRRYWNEMLIGEETILFTIGTIALAMYECNDAWTIDWTRVNKFNNCEEPF